MLGLFPFPQTVFLYCSFLSLLIILLSCLCAYVSWLPVLVLVSRAFTDFHFPNLFYSSVTILALFLTTHSFLPRGLALFPFLHQLSFTYLLPTFNANAVLFFIPPSSSFSVFLLFLIFLEKFIFFFQFSSLSTFPLMWHHTKSR